MTETSPPHSYLRSTGAEYDQGQQQGQRLSLSSLGVPGRVPAGKFSGDGKSISGDDGTQKCEM